MNYRFDFKNKTVLITGAANGIGLETCEAFLQNEAYVFMLDRDEKALDKSAAALKEKYTQSRIFTIVCDITDTQQVSALPDIIKEHSDTLDILVNNAGIAHSAYSVKETSEDWNRVITINLTAQFFMAQTIANAFFIAQNSGRIVNMASLGGVMGMSTAAAYSASKGGLIQTTKSLACEWARFGINVNCVCPGFVDTALIAENVANEKWLGYMTSRTPKRRLANPDDVAGAVLFLSSDMASFITGTSIVVDGGYSSGS